MEYLKAAFLSGKRLF